MLGLLIFRGEGKINTKSRETMIKKTKKKRIIYLFSFLVFCMTKQFTTGMWRPSAQLFVLWHFIFTSKTRHCCHKSVYNESVWRIPLRRRKTNKSWDWDLADKTDLSDVFKHRTGSYDKRAAELLWNLGVFFFSFSFSKIEQGLIHQDKHFRFRYCTSPWSAQVL